MSEYSGTEGLDIEALAAQMLGGNTEEVEEFVEEEKPQGHPAWQDILNAIPTEYHNQVLPTLQNWDAGVSRRFQKIHDEYAPYKQFEELDPDDIKEALNVYQALNTDPAATWEAIGRVYGLSPQQVSQGASDDSEGFDLGELPPAIRDRLLRVEEHEAALESISKELQARQALEDEAAEDEALERYIEELQKEYGEFDEEYVVGLIASGIDGEEAVGRFQEMTKRYQPQRTSAPRVMSSGGGVPSTGGINLSKLSNQDTQQLITEMLRQAQNS